MSHAYMNRSFIFDQLVGGCGTITCSACLAAAGALTVAAALLLSAPVDELSVSAPACRRPKLSSATMTLSGSFIGTTPQEFLEGEYTFSFPNIPQCSDARNKIISEHA